MHIAQLPVDEALRSLRTSAQGLSSADAAQRLQEYGPNRIEAAPGIPQWRRFLGEFTHFFARILWLAAALAGFAEWRSPGEGMWQLAVAIVAVILINGSFSYWQEYRAERAIAALRRLLPQSVKVMRDGTLQTLDADRLVPGDILELDEGDNVPADCRIVESVRLRVNMATVTGESLPRPRVAAPEPGGAALEARNLVLAGTAVVAGHGRAVVFATGMRTEFGRIAHLTQTADKSVSHLQIEIARLSRLVAVFATGLGLLFFAVGDLIGLPFWANLMFAIGIIVANVPEGLLPTVTLSLAMATQRMARRNALIRHLPAVETLGATTVICSDKTGTLTCNRMHVAQVFHGGRDVGATMTPSMAQLLRNARCNHGLRRSTQAGQAVWLGDPMEVALVTFGEQGAASFDPVRVAEVPFDGERRRMSVLVAEGDARWLFCKGAPEAVLPACAWIEGESGQRALDPEARSRIAQAQEAMADAGLRVLAFAWRAAADAGDLDERDLVFSGLIGLRDPPRPEVPEAIARCRSAGIRVIMITGDHPHTAVAIARDIGLVRGEHVKVVLGNSLRQMTPAQLQMALDAPEIVFARVTAEQKMRVVEALKHKGEIVAVTGDGVNDAPALKMAHIGIAMGIGGTDVAKAAADMVLLDDNFASIVNAVEEGRAVFENIRKFLTYILTSNIPELVPYLAFVLFRIPLPLTIIQILAVDLGTDMVPALALGAEPPGPELMRQPPRRTGERLLSWGLVARAYLWLGPLQALAALTAFFLVLGASGWVYGDMPASDDPAYLQATTACFAAIVVAQMVNLFLCRHPERSALRIPGRNPLLGWGLAIEAVLLLLIVYALPLQRLFGTAPFAPGIWPILLLLALGIGFLEELRKAIMRHLAGASTAGK